MKRLTHAERVAQYVDARRDLEALRQQLRADPAKLKHPRFAQHLEEALRESDVVLRTLTGGDLGKAMRQLQVQPTHTEGQKTSRESATTQCPKKRRRRRCTQQAGHAGRHSYPPKEGKTNG